MCHTDNYGNRLLSSREVCVWVLFVSEIKIPQTEASIQMTYRYFCHSFSVINCSISYFVVQVQQEPLVPRPIIQQSISNSYFEQMPSRSSFASATHFLNLRHNKAIAATPGKRQTVYRQLTELLEFKLWSRSLHSTTNCSFSILALMRC